MGKKVASQDSPEVYVGVDPGASGGVVVLYNGFPYLFNMPDTEAGVWDLFCDIKAEFPNPFACVEQVGGFMSSGRGKGNKASGHTMFNFGAGYGGLRMALLGNGIRREYVTPAVWQRGLHITPKAKTESQGAHKRKLKQRATELYPGVKVTLKTCDALLLATYLQRKRTGTL